MTVNFLPSSYYNSLQILCSYLSLIFDQFNVIYFRDTGEKFEVWALLALTFSYPSVLVTINRERAT